MRHTFLSIAILLLASVATAQTAERSLALNGLDPVALSQGKEVEGLEDLTAEHGFYRYQFESAANREQFQKDPDRWGIQWGGGCGRMGPLSGRGDPSRWTVHDERIYIFASEGCRNGFLEAPESFVTLSPEPAEPTDQAIREGREWLEKAIENFGGAASFDKFRAIRVEFNRPDERSKWMNHRKLFFTADGHVRSSSKWTPPDSDDSSETTWVVADTSFMIEDGVVSQPLNPDQIADVRRNAHRELLFFFWARFRPDFRVHRTPDGKFNGFDTVNVEITLDGLTTTLHIDPADLHFHGLSWRGRLNDGMTREITERFTGWTYVGDIRLPVRRIVSVDGEPNNALAMAIAWDGLEVYPEVPEEVLRVPGGR